jgi:hypothetical protein
MEFSPLPQRGRGAGGEGDLNAYTKFMLAIKTEWDEMLRCAQHDIPAEP